jgi:hypothetical protein
MRETKQHINVDIHTDASYLRRYKRPDKSKTYINNKKKWSNFIPF